MISSKFSLYYCQRPDATPAQPISPELDQWSGHGQLNGLVNDCILGQMPPKRFNVPESSPMPQRMNSSILRYDVTEERQYRRNSVEDSRACPMPWRTGSSMTLSTSPLDRCSISSPSHQITMFASPTPTMTTRNKNRRCQMALLPRGDAMRSAG
ncbi:uncharacterized protein SCHCODRAFT_02337057 [Schizophyllum commune H4-8]|uniref:uncharacterized protein n=1 Tax=Schizophyllum commune (strain H4-8 / FGSC 9210) TaxID=578458 RepID=UPI00215FDC59|nr:uncharacterized protein SCHCODRAFT_02337057 [Schizophyllum commune H4-8]KAI5890144.1 hypothetical protein SCHCODRAFT_02337057 [Schizophyllum commune H4-8]